VREREPHANLKIAVAPGAQVCVRRTPSRRRNCRGLAVMVSTRDDDSSRSRAGSAARDSSFHAAAKRRCDAPRREVELARTAVASVSSCAIVEPLSRSQAPRDCAEAASSRFRPVAHRRPGILHFDDGRRCRREAGPRAPAERTQRRAARSSSARNSCWGGWHEIGLEHLDDSTRGHRGARSHRPPRATRRAAGGS